MSGCALSMIKSGAASAKLARSASTSGAATPASLSALRFQTNATSSPSISWLVMARYSPTPMKPKPINPTRTMFVSIARSAASRSSRKRQDVVPEDIVGAEQAVRRDIEGLGLEVAGDIERAILAPREPQHRLHRALRVVVELLPFGVGLDEHPRRRRLARRADSDRDDAGLVPAP